MIAAANESIRPLSRAHVAATRASESESEYCGHDETVQVVVRQYNNSEIAIRISQMQVCASLWLVSVSSLGALLSLSSLTLSLG